jgi:hypothetical protein
MRHAITHYRVSVFNFAPTWDQFTLISIATAPAAPANFRGGYCVTFACGVAHSAYFSKEPDEGGGSNLAKFPRMAGNSL